MPALSREELLPFPDQIWLGFQYWQKKPAVNYEGPGISQRAFLGDQAPAQLLMLESAFGPTSGYDPGSLSPSLPFKEGYWRLKPGGGMDKRPIPLPVQQLLATALS